MDTMYFAKDMPVFVGQIKKWLKPDGVLFVGYQEGDVMPKTDSVHTAAFSKALEENSMEYKVEDITEQTYYLLKRKRGAALANQVDFEAEGQEKWFDMLMGQTECATVSFEMFREKMSRYLFVAWKKTI